jgi:hypothetical protein
LRLFLQKGRVPSAAQYYLWCLHEGLANRKLYPDVAQNIGHLCYDLAIDPKDVLQKKLTNIINMLAEVNVERKAKVAARKGISKA